MEPLHFWKKSVRPGRSDEWLEQLGAVVAAERLAVVTKANGRTVSLEAYLDTKSEVQGLARRFGGKTGRVASADWLAASAIAPGKPLAFGRHLLITGQAAELVGLKAASPARHVLCIPAAMAFGTGEHATTAMCLRFLAEVSAGLNAAGAWQVLDLGSGSGVLALAARLFGAQKATGLDNDPHAVRTARENAALNAIKRAEFRRVDLLRGAWPQSRSGGWPLVTANLFSELHIALLPQMASAMSEGGRLIASGILASQTPEVEAAFRRERLEVVTRRRRGRWVAYLARKEAAVPLPRPANISRTSLR